MLILLGIIGYSGYRVYPPLVDLWQRAREHGKAGDSAKGGLRGADVKS